MRKPLTALACDRLQSGALADARSPGLRLVATTGKKSWIYRYRLHRGPLRQLKLGEFARMTLAEAREAWAEQKKIRDRLLDPRTEKKKTIQAQADEIQAAYAVEEMVEDWIRLHATKLARSDEMERLLRREVLPRWKGRPAPSITRRDCVDLFEAVSTRAPRVAEQMMSAVRSKARDCHSVRCLSHICTRAEASALGRKRTLVCVHLSAESAFGNYFGVVVTVSPGAIGDVEGRSG